MLTSALPPLTVGSLPSHFWIFWYSISVSDRLSASLRFASACASAAMEVFWASASALVIATCLSASALATVINEQADKGGSAGNHRKLTPYVSATFKPFRNEEFRVRFFYKDIFRLPSFNDLYYQEVGNSKLKPENARQYNIGLTYSRNVCTFLPYLSATVDAYYNKVTDKNHCLPDQEPCCVEHEEFGQCRDQRY